MPSCSRARDEAGRCRHLLLAQQATDDRVVSLTQQAEQAAALGRWQNVIVLCEEALVVKPGASDVNALRERAIRARDNESSERKLEAQRALDRADALRHEGNYKDAEVELARARRRIRLAAGSGARGKSAALAGAERAQKRGRRLRLS